jgi:hypothetical protein
MDRITAIKRLKIIRSQLGTVVACIDVTEDGKAGDYLVAKMIHDVVKDLLAVRRAILNGGEDDRA